VTTIGAKVAYVKRQGQTRRHHCHWPGCDKQVPPAMWGCRPHWYSLPDDLRNAIWRSYAPGQEVKGSPSTAYVAAARAVQEWIKANHPTTAPAAPAQGSLL
jgi:hypothetical protein